MQSQGCINLADVINLFAEGKPKQGIFIVLTQSRAWKLQAIGDDPDSVRAVWMKQLEAWLNDNRPGFKKLKKMGFEKPTVVQGMLGPIVAKRSSVAVDVTSTASGGSPRFEPSSTESSVVESSVDEKDAYGVKTMKETALNYRRLELQIKIVQDSISTSSGNAELLARLKQLEQEREEKRAAAALREFQLSELEKEYDSVANTSRADFQELLKRVGEFHAKLLKPGFEQIQNVFETLQEGDTPEMSKEKLFELLSRFDATLPPVEDALNLSTTLLQKDRSGMLQRVVALEAENKTLQETLDDLDNKKARVAESSERLKVMSSQIKQTAEVFPKIVFNKEQAIDWLTTAPDENDSLLSSIATMASLVEDARGERVGDANGKLMRMEKLGENASVVVAEDGSIKSATVDALFSLLINGEGRIRHPEFEDAILYGFPSFASPMDLLEKMVLCFCSTLPSYTDERERKRADAIIEMNRKRLLTLMNKWLLYHEDHFREKSFSRFLQDFIVTVELSGLKEEAGRLRDRLNSNIFPFNGEYAPSMLPPDLNNFHLLDLAPMEVARQMTRLDAALFEVIETRDFLETAWTSKNPNVAQSVKAITKQFNRMSQWVASLILREDDLRSRASVIEFFILTAESCLQLNNFNGLLQIIGSLSKTEIHRLTNSWELVGRDKIKMMEAHRELLQSNCSLLRQRYAAAKPPCLPYLGTYLTDLVMIGEQKTRIGDKINYRKLQLQEKCLSALVRRNEEGIKFGFREVREIKNFILDDAWLYKTDDELMKRSLELEPRAAEGGTAKISKSKSVSGMIRGDSKARVVRKAPGGSDRMSMQASPAQSRAQGSGDLGTLNRKPSSTVLSQTTSTERGPPPNIRPSSQESSGSGSTSPRDRGGSGGSSNIASPGTGMSASVPAAADSNGPPPPTASFRTVRTGVRASSPNLGATAAAATNSPMIGNKRPTTTIRSNSGETAVLSSSPESPITPISVLKSGRPAPAPRRDMSSSGGGSATSPAPRKALPKPPTSTDVSDEEEEEDL